ncbi:uncharacterized protein LOC136091256 [Hydra vulgaris]|uniref:Uncharacterized protein LOC136091256 n=1 Tax=Hydra vulgaris TaxID=6087 RepID=A0ABM4DJG3_HYDVU
MEHKKKMIKVGRNLHEDNIAALKYIFAKKIGTGIEKIRNGLEMIEVLESIGFVSENNYKNFIDILDTLNRVDLISIINGDPELSAANTNETYDVLSSEIIDKAAYQIGTEWRRFGRHLNLKEFELEHIDVDYKSTYDKAFQLFKLWKQKSKEGCLTWSQLKNKLELFERFDIIRELITEFKQLRDMDELNIKSNIPMLKKVKELGSCAFGKIYLCINENTGKKLAVKCVETENINNNAMAKQDIEKFQHEVLLFQKLNHERIVKYYGTFYADTTISIAMEFMEGGSLYEKISNEGALDEKTASEKSYQILCGLEYLHNKSIIHRDIKSANILLDLHGNCKLADFGISKQIQTIRSYAGCKTYAGTPYWMSPEVINATVLNTEYGKKADIWSFGCTVLEMLTQKPPWSHLDPTSAIFHIGTKQTIPHLPGNSSGSCKTFVDDCFQSDPKLRPSALQLLSYGWVQRCS